ncbi:dimethylarginine dimethylaminohydrolase family protein [Flavitalea flava]
MATTCQSEIGKLRSLYIKRAADALIDESRLSLEWKGLNWTDKPDLAKALAEYEKFETIIKETGTEVLYFPRDQTVSIDSIYCRDAAISTDNGMILCNMGKSGRKYEPSAQKKAFEINGLPILGTITGPGTVEGGDVVWLDERTLAVGHTYRTNAAGIKQVEEWLNPLGIEVITVPLPHYKGPSDVFHLMSILSPVDKDLAVIYSPLMPIGFRNHLLGRGFLLVEVPDQEFDSMGCNVLALGPRKCLMVAGNPITEAALRKAGCTVITYIGEEISVKGGGGPTCLTRPVVRDR